MPVALAWLPIVSVKWRVALRSLALLGLGAAAAVAQGPKRGERGWHAARRWSRSRRTVEWLVSVDLSSLRSSFLARGLTPIWSRKLYGYFEFEQFSFEDR